MEILVTALLLGIAGFAIGILSGMLGIGGGMLMIPLLRLVYGLDAFMSTATSLFCIIPISISGAITRIRMRACIPKLGVILGLSGAITSSAGVFLGSISPAWLIMVVAALIIVYTSGSMLSKAIKMKPGNPPASKGEKATPASPAARTFPPFELSLKNVLFAIFTGLLAGFFSGYVGVGGGFIMIPLMISLLKISMKDASGTSLIAIIILAIPGVIQQIAFGHVDFLAGVMLCVGAIPGAIFGAWLTPRVPERTLRFVFSGLLVVAGALLVVNEFGLLG